MGERGGRGGARRGFREGDDAVGGGCARVDGREVHRRDGAVPLQQRKHVRLAHTQRHALEQQLRQRAAGGVTTRRVAAVGVDARRTVNRWCSRLTIFLLMQLLLDMLRMLMLMLMRMLMLMLMLMLILMLILMLLVQFVLWMLLNRLILALLQQLMSRKRHHAAAAAAMRTIRRIAIAAGIAALVDSRASAVRAGETGVTVRRAAASRARSSTQLVQQASRVPLQLRRDVVGEVEHVRRKRRRPRVEHRRARFDRRDTCVEHGHARVKHHRPTHGSNGQPRVDDVDAAEVAAGVLHRRQPVVDARCAHERRAPINHAHPGVNDVRPRVDDLHRRRHRRGAVGVHASKALVQRERWRTTVRVRPAEAAGSKCSSVPAATTTIDATIQQRRRVYPARIHCTCTCACTDTHTCTGTVQRRSMVV